MTAARKNWLEWIVFALGLMLIVGTLGYLVYDVATAGDAPPDLEVRLGEPRRASQGFLIPVTVANLGDHTAEGVRVRVELYRGEGEPERAEFEIPFVPRRSTREGWVTFRSDPRTAERIEAWAPGFEKP